MATDFHYVPLPPEPISGNAVLLQTEQAINDLGLRIDRSSEISEEALRVAQQAQTTAEAAQSSADTALFTAQDARTTATNANATANTALSTAQSAMSTAEAAQSVAGQASQAAQEAKADASLALIGAETAEARANDAYQAASDAQSIASSASGIAFNAMGFYTVNDIDSLDADAFFEQPEKLYVTGATPVNFPDITAPIYFDVYVTSDSTSATQRAWSQDGSEPWQRIASISPRGEENPEPIVTWGDWSPVGGVPEQEPAWLPLYFTIPAEAPTRSMIPPGYTTASLQSVETDVEGTAITLEATAAVGGGEAIAIPPYPETVDVSALVNKGVNFTVNCEGAEPTEVFALVRLSP